MVVKYIDGGKRAIFGELIYTRDDKTGYYLNSTIHKRLHRAVYEHFNGRVPEGCHVHHIDHNRANNEPENLTALSKAEHNRVHAAEMTEETRERLRDNIRTRAVPAAAEWHKSAAGHEWHLRHYEQTKDAMHRRGEKTCEQCGRVFLGALNGTTRFCSNACKSAYRRKLGGDDVIRTCKWCGKSFAANRYAKTRTCSRNCANHLRRSVRQDQGNSAATAGAGLQHGG